MFIESQGNHSNLTEDKKSALFKVSKYPSQLLKIT